MRATDLYEYKITDVRTSDEVINDIRQRCETALRKYQEDVIIYRGIRRSDRIGFGDSTKHKRRSRFATANDYNIWVSEDKSWASYPKRNRSYICSTKPSTAGAYGEVFIVLPIDNPVFGVCPAYDFQISFKRHENMGPLRLGGFISFVQAGWAETRDDIKNEKFNTYEQLTDQLEEIDSWFRSIQNEPGVQDWLDNPESEEAWNKMSRDIRRVLQYPNYLIFAEMQEKHLIEIVRWAFDPDENGFDIVALSDLPKLKDKEIWFSGESYFVRADTDLMDKILS